MAAPQTLVVTTHDVDPPRPDAAMVRTMLELISSLDRIGSDIATIVLGGDFARNHDLVSFLRDAYPAIDVVIEGEGAI